MPETNPAQGACIAVAGEIDIDRAPVIADGESARWCEAAYCVALRDMSQLRTAIPKQD